MLVIFIFSAVTVIIFLLALIKIILLVFSLKIINGKILSCFHRVYPMSMTTRKPIFEVVVNFNYNINGHVLTSNDSKIFYSLSDAEKAKAQFNVGDQVIIKVVRWFPKASYLFDFRAKILGNFFALIFSGLIAVIIYMNKSIF